VHLEGKYLPSKKENEGGEGEEGEEGGEESSVTRFPREVSVYNITVLNV
jgi:hypothetical protein